MKTFVIAGNRAEADDWIKKDLKKRHAQGYTTLSWSDYVVVRDSTTLRGLRDPHGVFIGTWRERKDMEDIFVALLSSITITNNAHRVVNQLWGEWKEGINKPTPKKATTPYYDAAKMLADEIDREVMQRAMGFQPDMVMVKQNGSWNIHDTNPLPYASRVASITTGLPPDAIKDVCRKINGGQL